MSKRVSDEVLDVGRSMGATRRELLAAGVTGIVESHFENLAGGEGTSVGWRQETASSYPGKNRRDVRAGAKRFFREARAHRGQKMSVGQLAQAVQRSAFPERYQQHLGEARRLLGSGGIESLTGPSQDNPRKTIEVQDPREAMAAAFASGRRDVLGYASELLASGAYTRKSTLPDDPARYNSGAGAGGASGKVVIAPGADRKGARTGRGVVSFVESIAGVYGHSLTIGTGTQHNRMTTSGNVSDHWDGHAADIPMSGKALTRLGQAALVAAGKSPAWARKQKGGVYNIMYKGHRVQILFNTNVGGNHWDHLHAGIR